MYRVITRVAAAVLVAAVIIATTATPAAALPAPRPASLEQVISNLTGWVVGILAGVATLFLTIGGARYLAAGGDPSEVERAKGALKNAGIGYALAILAPVLLVILQQILGI